MSVVRPGDFYTDTDEYADAYTNADFYTDADFYTSPITSPLITL